MKSTDIPDRNTTSLQEQLAKYVREGFTGKLEFLATQQACIIA
jgi:hypothetical protein